MQNGLEIPIKSKISQGLENPNPVQVQFRFIRGASANCDQGFAYVNSMTA